MPHRQSKLSISIAIQLAVFLVPALLLTVRSGAEAALAVLLVISLVGLYRERPRIEKESLWLCLGLGLFPLVTLIRILVEHPVPWAEFDAASRFLLLIPLLLYLPHSKVDLERPFQMGCVVGAVTALLAVLEGVSGGILKPEFRATTYFINPIPFSCMVLLLAFGSLQGIFNKGRTLSIIGLTGFAAGVGAAVASQSRGMLIAFPLAACVWLLFNTRLRRGRAMIGTAVLSALFIAFAVTTTSIGNRVEIGLQELGSTMNKNEDSSIGVRAQLWKASVRTFSEHPWFGIGKGEFPKALAAFVSEGSVTKASAENKHSHNELLFALTEMGLPGGIAVLALYAIPFALFWRRRHSGRPQTRRAAAMGAIALVCFGSYGIADCMLNITMQTAFLAFFIVLAGAITMQTDALLSSASHSSKRETWLVLSHCFNMDGRAASQVIVDKIPALMERGITPVVVSGIMGKRDIRFPHYQVLPFGPSGLRFDLRHVLAEKLGKGVAYRLSTLLISIALGPFIVIERLLFGLQSHASWTLSAVIVGYRLIAYHRISAIYSTGGAYSAHWAAYWLKRITGLPWLAEIHDPMLLPNTKLRGRNVRRIARIEALICQHSDLAWWFTEGALESARRRHPLLGERGFAVPAGSSPINADSLPAYQAGGSVMTFAHFGSLSDTRSLSTFVRAVSIFLERCPDRRSAIVCHLYGSNLDSAARDCARQLGVEALFVFKGRLDRATTLRQMALSDCLLLVHGDGADCAEYIPAKVYEYFYARRPILASIHLNPELDRLIAERHGYVAASTDVETIVEAIDRAFGDWAERRWQPAKIPAIGVEDSVKEIVERCETAGVLQLGVGAPWVHQNA